MTRTLDDRDTSARADDLELAGLVLATLPRLIKVATAAHEGGGLTTARAGVLFPLRDRAFRSGELAQRCGMTAPALTEVVDSLEQEGRVRRSEDPSDRRVVLVELTGRGRRELDRYRDITKQRVARLLAGLGPDRRARLRAALADLHETIEAVTKE